MSNNDSATVITPADAEQPSRARGRRPDTRGGTPGSTNWAELARFQADRDEESAPLTFQGILERFSRWLKGAVAAGYGISLALHAILVLLMSFIVFTELMNEQALQTTMTESEEIEMLQDVLDIRIDMPAGDVSATNSLETALKLDPADWADNPIVNGVEDSVESLFEKEGAGGAGGAGFLAPSGARVFTKGSFSAWTVPNDPRPGQDYDIVIVVRLPDRVKRYQASDLKGIVVGTDGYRQEIPGLEYTRGRVYLPLKDQTAQLIVRVPGAASRVRDKIEIRSTTLNEKQLLEIEF